MDSWIVRLLFLILILSPLASIEEQSYQVRVIIDESRKEKLIFPLPPISYDYEKNRTRSENHEIILSGSLNIRQPVVDLCGIIPINEES